MPRSLVLVGCLLVAASLLCLSIVPPAGTAAPHGPAALLERVSGFLRFTGCRLTGGIRPARGGEESSGSARTREISRVLDEIERQAEAEPSPESLRALGVLRLAERRYREALLTLESVSLRPAAGAASLSDLAAAYLDRGQAEKRPFDSILALIAANRALAVQPGLAEALFNRAEALTRLQLKARASAAWDSYLQADPTSPWVREAGERRRGLDEPTLDDLWEQDQPRLDAALARQDLATIREIVARLPFRTRTHGEEKLLAEWAEGAPPAGRADRLAAAHILGEALRERAQDEMLADAVAAIERARDRGDAGGLAALRRAHLDYSRGLRFYREQDCTQARPLLLAAKGALEAGGSPFAGWPALYAEVCEHYSSSDRALQGLEAVRRRYDPRRYPSLTGRIEWMLGTAENNRGRPETALAHFRRAFEQLDGSAGLQASGFVHVLLGEAYQSLGQLDQAWSERLAGIAASRRLGDPLRIHPSLYDAADRLLDQGLPGPALDFSEELVLNAEAFGNPTALAEAYQQRGRALAALGRRPEALADLRSAAGHAVDIPQGAVRERIRSTLELVEGEDLAERDPLKAVQLLGQTLSARLSRGYLYRLLPLLTSRARAFRKLGDLDGSENDLRLAIEAQERLRGDVKDLDLRLSSFGPAQTAFDEMVRLQVDRYADASRALEYAERARGRLLLDLVAGRGAVRLPRALTAARLRERLPADVVLVEYLVLPERLLAWVVRSGSIRLVQTRISEGDLDPAVQILRTAMERRASLAEIRSAAAPLYEALIRPLAADLPDGAPLVVVPDRSLVQVPFAALFDARRGRYLAEDHTLTVAPSATLYLAATERLTRFSPSAPWSALVVGDPAFDRQRHPHLSRLDAAAAEADEVAALYDGPDLLRGEAATRSAFLASAPGHRIVHFAGHALLQPLSPGLSMLLFAPNENDSGPLYARDLAGYRLEGTELVVLSSCRTLDDAAASRESLVGLAAAFLAAGPPVVVSSLWKADDAATRNLMLSFHRAFRQGADPAAALRSAQLRLLRGPEARFRSPAYWAGFEAFGAGNRRSGPSPSLEAAALQR